MRGDDQRHAQQLFGGVRKRRRVEGFGAAAKHLAPYFRMKPKTVDGQPVEGAQVTIPIRFSMN